TASCIRYLDNSVAFIGSATGDSQLIKINSVRDDSSGEYIQLLENYQNLGPIIDMTTLEMDLVLAGHAGINLPSNASSGSVSGQANSASTAGVSQSQIV